MIDSLWQDARDENGFQASFSKALNEKDVNMMQYLAENPKLVPNFGKTNWTASHTVAFGMRGYHMNFDARQDVWEQFFIKQKFNQFHLSQSGYLPIHLACKTNNVTVLKLIIDTIDRQDLTKLLNHVTKDKYWQFTPLMIAIENNGIDCVKMLCKFDEIDLLNIKARYPNYNSLQFACYYNNIDILKIIVYKIVNSNVNTIFTRKMIDEMIEIAKYAGNHNDLCVEFLSQIVDNEAKEDNEDVNIAVTATSPVASSSMTMVIETADDPIKKSFDYKASRMKMITSDNYVCINYICNTSGKYLVVLQSEKSMDYQCSLCKQNRKEGDINYQCTKCNFVFCEECAFLFSIINRESKDNAASLMKNQEFITLLRNDTKIVKKV